MAQMEVTEKALEILARYKNLPPNGQRPRSCYGHHRSSAKVRGIGFELTFHEWWKIWKDSGKWLERGRSSHCYAMARHGDVGPYAVGNVSIITVGENCRAVKINIAAKRLVSV